MTEAIGPMTPKYLLSSSLQKKFADGIHYGTRQDIGSPSMSVGSKGDGGQTQKYPKAESAMENKSEVIETDTRSLRWSPAKSSLRKRCLSGGTEGQEDSHVNGRPSSLSY